MNLKKKLLNASRVYIILDASVKSYEELYAIAKLAIKNGVGILQLRDKKGGAKKIVEFARMLKALCAGRCLFIVNDRLDIALAVEADGVHLGQEDMPLSEAQRLTQGKMLIGKSCQTFAQIKEATKEGADYIGFGSVFKTLTKPERSPQDLALIKEVFKNCPIPMFAIGGITVTNCNALTERGVTRVAVCRDIICVENPDEKIAQFQNLLTEMQVVS